MKTKLLKSTILNLGLIALFACQQVPSASNSNGGYTDTSTDDGNDIELCSDGTFNCYVTLEPGVTNIFNTTIFDQSFETCMTTCLVDAGCTDYIPLDDAIDACPTSYSSCSNSCEWMSSESPYEGMPSCEPIGIPENPKAVKVEITTCYDEQAPYEILFTGPSVRFDTILEGKRGVDSYGIGAFSYGDAKLGYGPGRSPKCEDAYDNRVQVTFTPLADSTLTLGSQTIAITPFGNTEVIDRTYARPDNLSFGIPEAIRSETDLSQIAWMIKDYGEPSNEMQDVMEGFCHYKNDNPYGTSLVLIDYNKKLLGSYYANQTVTMYLLIKGI